MGCGINKTTRPKIVANCSSSNNKKKSKFIPVISKKTYKNKITCKSWLNILDFLSYNEIKEIGKTSKLFNYLVKQDAILIKFFKNKNSITVYQNVSRNLIRESSSSKEKINIKCYESFALLQRNQIYESIDSNYSTSSERLII